MKIPVQLKILDERIGTIWKAPDYESSMAAGIDVRACIDEPIVLLPQASAVLIPTGIAAYIGDPGWCYLIFPRSGLAHKRGLILGNSVGVVDADYQNEVFVSAWNRNPWGEFGKDVITIDPGERIAQLVFLPIARANFKVVEEFEEVSGRGLGGFGSTGTG